MELPIDYGSKFISIPASGTLKCRKRSKHAIYGPYKGHMGPTFTLESLERGTLERRVEESKTRYRTRYITDDF